MWAVSLHKIRTLSLPLFACFFFLGGLLLESCNCSEGSKQLSIQIPDLQQISEFEKLRALDYGSASRFLIDPVKVAEKEYIEPHWWGYWAKKLNYLEEKVPSEIGIYSGRPGEEASSTSSIRWNNCKLELIEHFSLSQSQQLLCRNYLDSVVFSYDIDDRLKQTVSYSGWDRTDVSYLRLYEHDQYGNIRWVAVFFHNDSMDYYLNHLQSFKYHECDSGVHVQRDQFYIYDGRVDHSSTSYSFFDEDSKLISEYLRFSAGAQGRTTYTYMDFEGEDLLCKKEMYDLLKNKLVDREIFERDSLNRLTLHKHQFAGLSKDWHLLMDSVIHLSDFERQEYHYEIPTSLSHNLNKVRQDSYGNTLVNERFEFTKLNEPYPILNHTYEYQLLEAGTWYSAIERSSWPDDKHPEENIDYHYRKFDYMQSTARHNNYQADEKLLAKIENFFPELFVSY